MPVCASVGTVRREAAWEKEVRWLGWTLHGGWGFWPLIFWISFVYQKETCLLYNTLPPVQAWGHMPRDCGNKLSESVALQMISYLYFRHFVTKRRLTYSDEPCRYGQWMYFEYTSLFIRRMVDQNHNSNSKEGHQLPEASSTAAWQKGWEQGSQIEQTVNPL